jgi:hypothetical protein
MSLVAKTIQMPNNDASLLEHYQEYGFHSPDDMVHKAFELLEGYLQHQPNTSSLNQVQEAINEALKINFFIEDWDGEGAPAIKREIWERATTFLINYVSSIENLYHIVVESPEINPCPDGSIDLSWRTTEARMLINIRNTHEGKAFYYGDLYEDKNSIKGNVNTEKVELHLAAWMCNLKSI